MSNAHPPGAPYSINEPDESEAPHTLRPDERSGWRWAKHHLRWPLLLCGLYFAVLCLTSWERVTKPSQDTHFAYLAETYLEMIQSTYDPQVKARRAGLKPFEMARKPPHGNDWASYWELTTKDGEVFRGIWNKKHGRGEFRMLDKRIVILQPQDIDQSKTKRRFFVSFPPGPALVFLPLTALSGIKVNDVLLTIVFASLNVGLLFALLERLARGGRSGRSRKDNLWLILLFALGTCHYWLSVMGQVWFTAQIMGVTWTLLYIHCAIDAKRPLLAGLFCAMAFATRTPLLFSSLFFFLWVLFPNGQRLQRAQLGWAVKKLALFCAPCLAVGISLLVINHMRFESFTEFGHTYLAAGQLQRIKTYGLFHPHFLSKNLSTLLTLLPVVKTQAPYIAISTHGMSILLTTPAFFYLVRPQARKSIEDKTWHRILWATVAAIALPSLFYQNTGYAQFGFRFSVDYTIYLIMLLATGRHAIDRWFKATIIWSVGVNAFGAVTFKRFTQFYTNKFFI